MIVSEEEFYLPNHQITEKSIRHLICKLFDFNNLQNANHLIQCLIVPSDLREKSHKSHCRKIPLFHGNSPLCMSRKRRYINFNAQYVSLDASTFQNSLHKVCIRLTMPVVLILSVVQQCVFSASKKKKISCQKF